MAIRIGLVGTGTVGGGCLEILSNHKQDFLKYYGIDLELSRVCSRNPEEAIKYGVEDVFTQDFNELVNDPNVDIVVEVVGGTTVAKDIVINALSANKHVVTANKALMASYGEEVMALARRRGKEVLFEASVGGGIPIIGPLKHSLIANRIDSVMGIVNGTTNYMLTRMAEDNMSYDDALKEAQEKGFAEADPSADVDGHDAAAKIAILASIAFNARVTLGDVPTEGIRDITPSDLAAAQDMGYCVKLLAHAHREKDGIDVRVHPTMIPLTHPLATVNGVFNAIYVVGDAVGQTMFFGEGAGAGAAASAIMGDVLECARHIQADIVPLPDQASTDDLPFVPMEDLKIKYYIRFAVADRAGVLASMAGVFAQHNVSVHSMVQRGKKEDGGTVDLVYVTHIAHEKSVSAALEDIAQLDDVLRGKPSVIRVQD